MMMDNSTKFNKGDRVQIKLKGDSNYGKTGTVYMIGDSERWAWVFVSIDGVDYPFNIIEGKKYELIGEQPGYRQSYLKNIN